ncbi:MAG TPA: hydrogen gas-evolving membrane-bound hydrogenase subunit E [Thermomicrobiales bacterium]|nr:hydrogen gas-evolving membrane-bound hydrogenase subunit E [Thermomicrobiales bacterium]
MDDGILNPTGLLLLIALTSAPVALGVGRRNAAWTAPAAAVMAALGVVVTLWGWVAGESQVNLAWAPSWNLRFAFALDGLARLYALLATGIGLAVVLYAGRYIPLHLAHQKRDQDEVVPFFGLLMLFMGAMLGLVMAQDLLILFVFWDITAIASYLLIGFDQDDLEARAAALLAILITGVSAVCLLIGALLYHAEFGTFSLPNLQRQVGTSDWSGAPVAAGLILLAALAKSAQVPMHFWLPRAMAAPTPVSAYLHSAAMVAAGVFLIGRVYPLIALEQWLLDSLLVIGFASMVVGGVLATTRTELKQILAYSTISQYGYVVAMFGMGGKTGVGAASFYVVVHALAKSALFLTAGAVTEATGEKRLARLGGLRRSMPALAVGSGAAAAGLAALPLTSGFFKDELFFKAALERGEGVAALAVAGAALTIVYIGRFWMGIFLGPSRSTAHVVPPVLVAPVVVLGALVVLTGMIVGPIARLAEGAATVSYGAAVTIHPAYHLDARAENLMTLATFGLGGFLLATRRFWHSLASNAGRAGELIGPARLFASSVAGLNRASTFMRRTEVRDLRGRVATILAPAGFLVVAAVLATPTRGVFQIGAVGRNDLPMVLVLTAACGAALATALPRDHVSMALIVSGLGYCLAVVYAFFGAPDVALVAVLIETIFTILLLGTLALFPPKTLEHRSKEPSEHQHLRRDGFVAAIAGLVAFVVAWSALSRPAFQESVAIDHARLAPSAHAKDIVTAILTDFRGLDTMGEITVISIALLGIAGLLRRGRLL